MEDALHRDPQGVVVRVEAVGIKGTTRWAKGPGGGAAIAFVSAAGEPRELPLTPALMAGQDYREGRVKHVQLAVQAAMSARPSI